MARVKVTLQPCQAASNCQPAGYKSSSARAFRGRYDGIRPRSSPASCYVRARPLSLDEQSCATGSQGRKERGGELDLDWFDEGLADKPCKMASATQIARKSGKDVGEIKRFVANVKNIPGHATRSSTPKKQPASLAGQGRAGMGNNSSKLARSASGVEGRCGDAKRHGARIYDWGCERARADGTSAAVPSA